MDRNARNVLHQRQTHIGRQARATQAVEFFNVLTSPELLQTTEALLPEHRERLYPPTVTLSMFMRQVSRASIPSKAGARHSTLTRACATLHLGRIEAVTADYLGRPRIATKPVIAMSAASTIIAHSESVGMAIGVG